MPKNPNCKDLRDLLQSLKEKGERYGVLLDSAVRAKDFSDAAEELGFIKDESEWIIEKINVGLDPLQEDRELIHQLKDSYKEMVRTLRAFGFEDKVPSRAEVIRALRKLGREILRNIRVGMRKPTIIITPKGDFASKVEAIDSHKQMKGQKPTLGMYSGEGKWDCDAPFEKMTISVVDGYSHEMASPDDMRKNIDKLMEYKNAFEAQGFNIMRGSEYAMLMMKSLRKGNPVDSMRMLSMTFFNIDHLNSKAFIPSGFWNYDHQRVDFNANDRMAKTPAAHFRPSVTVMEVG